ncbi:unannotated protein [freshwater metagenome]|uniref:Unannotated protein n=1 Tax=freshwater metagenome TaxID=449393 RepID=A0A6J7D375_9ZZZZ
MEVFAYCWAAATLVKQQTPTGTTGFDAVVSRGWLRVEVLAGLVKQPAKTISADSHEYALAV